MSKNKEEKITPEMSPEKLNLRMFSVKRKK